ncbi:sigma-70 family RNA polymerase sigma factor [Kocuria palustris]|uniref:sigma-70 family RNA polymerase sigma factor n=1 Tax=Kocuria palustris TaxID=71999 RepID=UPI001D39C5B3|nr:sigma-70 family RNA polymerase sigma factor [Kocuria palustris]MBZ6375581.1 sigma-70 family RNA polymerase sigma factor [Kocuria palustris]
MNPHHENPADSEPEATSHGPASGHEPRPQDGAEAGPGTQTPRSAADDAGAAAAPIAPADLESPQEESAAPEDEAIADEALLDSARAGDESSYAALYERHRSTALNVARMHTRNVHDAEDLVSEAFARILSVLRRGGGPRKYMRSYLVTTIGRLAVDHGMAAGRVRPSEDEAELDRSEEFDDVVVRQCEAAVVATAYGSLPERWQAVLWHTEIEGMKPAAVAEELQISPNAVSALAKRARQGLQSAYLQAQVSAEATDACPEYAGELGAFAAGTLASRRRAKLQQHLDACPRCTAEYLQLEDVGVGLRVWILPVLAALPLWGTESKVLTAILASGTGSALAAGAGASSAGGSAEVSGGSGQAPADPSALTPTPADGAVAAGSATAAGSAGGGSAGGAGSASEGGKLGMGAAVAGGTGLKVAVGVVAAAAAVSLVGLGVSTLVRHDDGGASAIGGLPFPAGEGEVDSSDEQSGEGDGDGRGGDDGADSGGSLFGDAAGDAGADSAPGGGTSSADPADASDSADRLAAFGPADQADDQSAGNGADSGSEASAEDSRAGNEADSGAAGDAAAGGADDGADRPASGGGSGSGASGSDGGASGGTGGEGAPGGSSSGEASGSGSSSGDPGSSGTTDPAPQPAPTGEPAPEPEPTPEPTAEPTGPGDEESPPATDDSADATDSATESGEESADSEQSDTGGTTSGSGSSSGDPGSSGTTDPAPQPAPTGEPAPEPGPTTEQTTEPPEPGDEESPPTTDDSTDQATDAGGTTPGSGSTDPNQPPDEVEGATWVWVPREQWPRLRQTLWPWGSGYWELSADTAE